MKFCQPIKPLELFTDEELTDAFCCGGQHQFAIEIFERWNKARAELAKAREALLWTRSYVLNVNVTSDDERERRDMTIKGMDVALAPATEKGQP